MSPSSLRVMSVAGFDIELKRLVTQSDDGYFEGKTKIGLYSSMFRTRQFL